ncbi:MAG: hypothetical protein KBB70_00805 [Candidatus Pacebacteria bacterium]|jgi:hypothetical protein|nr:hypothetical protein [Candidatus Paceibacterota bacterium]
MAKKVKTSPNLGIVFTNEDDRDQALHRFLQFFGDNKILMNKAGFSVIKGLMRENHHQKQKSTEHRNYDSLFTPSMRQQNRRESAHERSKRVIMDPEILSIPIEHLNFSTWTLGLLKKHHLRTLAEVAEKNKSFFLRTPGMGIHTLREVEKVMRLNKVAFQTR